MKKKLNKTLKLTALGLITFAIGGAILVSAPQHYESAQAYEYNEDADTLYLSAQELNYNTYSYLAEKIGEWITNPSEYDNEYNELIGTTINYKEDTYEYDTAHNIWISETAEDIEISLTSNGKWNLEDTGAQETLYFEYGITINTAQIIYDNIKADFSSNDLDDITDTIETGLGLISDLAQQFLNGFKGLFWDSQANKLSDFGLFAMVMLGVSITFAVISLCLNVLRSNTGA